MRLAESSRVWARGPLRAGVLLLAGLVLVACGGDGEPAEVVAQAATTEPDGQDEAEPGGGALSMGAGSMSEGALGDQSTTIPLARGLLQAELGASSFAEGLVWAAYTLELARDDLVEGTGAAGFVYVVSGRLATVVAGTESVLEAEQGAQVGAGVRFSLRAVGGPATVWDIRLVAPTQPAPDYASAAPLAWRSRPLQDVPLVPLAVMALVIVPPGGETVVHTHPGPEFIVVTSGRIDYQNGFKESLGITRGATETIAPGVPVQKRNPFDADGVFLSLFLLDAGQPFATLARFDGARFDGARFDSDGADDSREPNLASLANGGRVVGVSSAFAGASLEARWGGNSAVDGDPSTQWSSDGDGDDAWIEIALAEPVAVTRVGFWTRTMGASAEIRTFQIVTDGGQTYGPFALTGPSQITYFDVSFRAQRLRFEALETSTGNTGAVEIEVYGEPAS